MGGHREIREIKEKGCLPDLHDLPVLVPSRFYVQTREKTKKAHLMDAPGGDG
jgi:hypothetical protein